MDKNFQSLGEATKCIHLTVIWVLFGDAQFIENVSMTDYFVTKASSPKYNMAIRGLELYIIVKSAVY
jgi:hypothetical protein